MKQPQKVLITGGAGFIGSNTAARYLAQGAQVLVVDNFSRAGTEMNFDWLRTLGGPLKLEKADIRDADRISQIVQAFRPELVVHLAAQVAVTTSLVDPRSDLEINIIGTFNVLEAIRKHAPEAVMINASTNKVYGHLDQLPIKEAAASYQLVGGGGVGESTPLDFYSPYGCSKGAADQYAIDYARIYGTHTITMRQSCIYGYRQFGIEDQGWVAWFIIAHILGKPITLYGNGKQVRDVLFIDDLVDCYQKAASEIKNTKGKAYNIGGGPENCISLIEFMFLLEEISRKKVAYTHGDWRPGDQHIYVSDVSKAKEEFGWKPTIEVRTGIEKLYRWVYDNKEMFAKF